MKGFSTHSDMTILHDDRAPTTFGQHLCKFQGGMAAIRLKSCTNILADTSEAWRNASMTAAPPGLQQVWIGMAGYRRWR
jgi:hypothetical protein